jgi:hypothetical protein
VQDVDALSGRQERADDNTSVFDVRSEERKRIGVMRAREGVERGGGGHDQIMSPVHPPAAIETGSTASLYVIDRASFSAS